MFLTVSLLLAPVLACLSHGAGASPLTITVCPDGSCDVASLAAARDRLRAHRATGVPDASGAHVAIRGGADDDATDNDDTTFTAFGVSVVDAKTGQLITNGEVRGVPPTKDQIVAGVENLGLHWDEAIDYLAGEVAELKSKLHYAEQSLRFHKQTGQELIAQGNEAFQALENETEESVALINTMADRIEHLQEQLDAQEDAEYS